MIHRFASRLSAFAGSAVLVGGGMLLGLAPAWADTGGSCAGAGNDDSGACDITASVTQVPTSVTFSNSTQTNNVKYQVTLTHYQTNTEAFNTVKFVGDAVLTGGVSGTGTAKILGATNVTVVDPLNPSVTTNCAVSPNTHIECTFSFLTPFFTTKGATIAFDITVQSPIAAATQPAATLNFNSTTSWTEAGGQFEGEYYSLVTPTSLAIPDPKVVATYLPTPGAVTTGTAGGAATCTQPWVTIVKVPAPASVSVDLRLPTGEPILGTGNYSQVSIPGGQYGPGVRWYDPGAESKLLVITLRRDACTIGDGDRDFDDALKILKEKIFYKSDSGASYNQVLSCFVTSGPTPGNPCIARRKVYTKFNLPPVSDPNRLQYLGDHEWVLYANENGKYQN